MKRQNGVRVKIFTENNQGIRVSLQPCGTLQMLRERVGHTFMKQRMKTSGAIFACEHSGHFYYKKNYRADSGMITSLLMCEIMCLERKPLSEIAKEFKKYSQIEEKSVKVKDKIAMIKKIEKLGNR